MFLLAGDVGLYFLIGICSTPLQKSGYRLQADCSPI